VPAAPHLPAPLLPESLAQHGREFGFPRAHGFLSEDHTPLKKHLSEVTQPEVVADAPPHHQTDDVGRIVHAIKDRAGAFIEPPRAATAAKAAVAPSRGLGTFACSRGLTVRALHPPAPPRPSILSSALKAANWRES